jgi:hypothetical protein
MTKKTKKLSDSTILDRLRKHFAQRPGGGHFRRSGHDELLKRVHGAWYVLDDAGAKVRSARGDGYPDETLRQLAARLDLLVQEV